MKLEHKTIKYIAYGLILLFFIVLISQNTNKQLFEGLENKGDTSTTNVIDSSANIITTGVFKGLETEKAINELVSSNEYSDLINIGTGRYLGSEQKYIDQSPLLNSRINVSNTQYAADITNLKHGLGLDVSSNVQQTKDLITTLDYMSEHIKLVGLNLINGNLNNIIGGDVTQFMKFYMTNYADSMKVLTDLKTYLQNNTTKASGVKVFGL